MEFYVRVRTRARPGTWTRLLITVVIIVIVTVAAWVGYGPATVIALFAGGGLGTQAVIRSITPVPR